MSGIKPNAILNEAKLLREHKGKLESRMKVLEEHNQQLISQLGKLKCYLGPVKTTSSLCDTSLPGQSLNKTGTLNIKSVTASQLAMDSPILPQKMNGHYIKHQSLSLNSGSLSDPPALPPRSAPHPRLHGDGVTKVKTAPMQLFPPAVPPKRSSLTRSELFLHPDKSHTVSLFHRELNLQNPRSREVINNKKVPNINGGAIGHHQSPQSWTDSLPRRDFYNFGQSGNTSSLPRRDKAGLGRPEPISNTRNHARDYRISQKMAGFVGAQGSLNEKRNSTGNLYFTDTVGPIGSTETRHYSQQVVTSITGYISEGCARQDPHETPDLKNFAGDLGKELKNLISIMDEEAAEEATARPIKNEGNVKKQ